MAMAILTSDMKRVVEEQRLGFVATVCADGTPNLSPKGTTAVWDDEHLVFAHPQTGNPLDGGTVTKRFQAACRDAGVRPIRFHDLRHTFATQLAASGKVSLRTLQEFLGHADAKTTQIYADYAPSTHEVEMVNAAFAAKLEEASDTAPD